MRFKILLNKFGQTTVEYILILAVSAGLGATFFKSARKYLLDDPNSYLAKNLRDYTSLLSDPQFKTFKLNRYR